MAVIGQIRKHSGLLVVVVGVALAAFVLGDLLQPRQKRPSLIIGEINGTDIHVQTFNDRVNELIDNLKAQQQTDRISSQEEFQVRQQVWNQLVEEILLGDVFKTLGLTVTKEELANEILGKEPHRYVRQAFTDPSTGNFDPEFVSRFVRELDKQSPEMRRRYLNLERVIKDDIIRTKLRNLLQKNYHFPSALASFDHQTKNQAVDVKFVAPKYADLSDTLVNVTDNDLRRYYEENKHNYKQEESRTFDYVLFEIVPSQEDRMAVRNEMDRLYQQFLNTDDPVKFVNSFSDDRFDSSYLKESQLPASMASVIMESPVGYTLPPFSEGDTYYLIKVLDKQSRPDSIKMSHILITSKASPEGFQFSDRTEEQAKKLVDSIITAARKNPAVFGELAAKYSDNPSAKEDKGELGWLLDGSSSDARFFNEGLKLKVNEPGKMDIAIGTYIVMVHEKTPPRPKVKIAKITRTVVPSTETYNQIYARASQFASENRTMAKFDTAVIAQGLNKRTAERIGKMTNRIAGVEFGRQLVHWAFRDNTRVGDVSGVFEDQNQFIVAVLKEIKKEGYMSFDEAKEMVRPFATNQVKGRYLAKKIKDLKAGSLKELSEKLGVRIDSSMNLQFSARTIPGFISEPQVIGRFFSLEPQKLSEPIEGYSAVFVAEVQRTIPAPETSDFSSIVFQMKNSFDSRVNGNAYVRALEKESKIKDNRILFY